MRSRLWPRCGLPSSKWIRLLTLAALPFGNVVADDAPFGIYSGQCTLNNEPTRVELEIVRNEKYFAEGADAILSCFKKGETSPMIHITMTGGFRDVRQPRVPGDRSPPKTKREFQFSAADASEEFGGRFKVDLIEEGPELKGTLALVRRRTRGQPPAGRETPANVPLVLSRSVSKKAEERCDAWRNHWCL
jgi:hypothetical protein